MLFSSKLEAYTYRYFLVLLHFFIIASRKDACYMDVKKCNVLAAEIRLETLEVILSRCFGHVGGSMGLAYLMAVWYG